MKTICCWGIVFVAAISQGASAAEPKSDEAWRRIAPYFQPPTEFSAADPALRSPLEFYDGQPVRTVADWQARREEIRSRWQKLMGPWPPVIAKPRFDTLKSERRENFAQRQVRLEWLPQIMTDGYLLVPDGAGRRPAVIVVFYEPETAIGRGKEQRDFAYQLTKRGFVTLSIGNREGQDNKTYSIYYPSKERAAMQPLSALAYAAANAYQALAGCPEVDPQRIGIMGHSFGGKWAMFASCLYDKFACAAWSDPGIIMEDGRPSVNYWEPWYLGYESGKQRTRGLITPANPAFGLYPRLLAEGYNLHELHALMAPRPFLVSGGSEDPPHRWRALNHTVRVNELLGAANRVAMTNRPDHSPNQESNELLCLFFERFLRP